jgi:hypothetical protein
MGRGSLGREGIARVGQGCHPFEIIFVQFQDLTAPASLFIEVFDPDVRRHIEFRLGVQVDQVRCLQVPHLVFLLLSL